jgi:hypothetical protein
VDLSGIPVKVLEVPGGGAEKASGVLKLEIEGIGSRSPAVPDHPVAMAQRLAARANKLR